MVTSVLQSKFGRRILFLFAVCALLPVASLAFLSYRQGTAELRLQVQRRLRHTSKNAGMIVLEQLAVLRTEMAVEGRAIRESRGRLDSPRATLGTPSLKRRLESLTLIDADGKRIALFGAPSPPISLHAAQRRHLVQGKALVFFRQAHGGPLRLYLAEAIDPLRPEQGLLVGEVDTARLWRYVTSALSANQDLSILGPHRALLYSSRPLSGTIIQAIYRNQKLSPSGQFAWGGGAEATLSSYWSVFLRPAYLAASLTVVTSEYRADAFAPVSNFTSSFLEVSLLTFLVVLLLASIHIRRNLSPLARIKEGTQRVSRGDFSQPIRVESGDEFEDLALSFNRMADHLRGQFNTLANMGQLVKKILSALENEKIVEVVLTEMGSVVGCDWVGIALLSAVEGGPHVLCWGEARPARKRHLDPVRLSGAELEQVKASADLLLSADVSGYRDLLAPLRQAGATDHLLLPILAKERLWGILVLGYRHSPGQLDEDRIRSRQIADQTAVALANAGLMEELAQFNEGALLALARTVDANSPWTAGHSERVTEIALAIGERMGLSPRGLEVLHRGALLHDLGKLGVPGQILDKPGKLSAEEFAVIKSHPELGARILEPIAVYKDIIPLVLQHHEWFDGRGYPRGLAGEAISLEARILAVADTLDALSSDRPYRPGWEADRVETYLREGAGTQFDPSVVRAYLALLAEGRPPGGAKGRAAGASVR